MDDSAELLPRTAPIPGGGRCDVCGRRAFRIGRTGRHRHVGCEPAGALLSPIERSARDYARRIDARPVRAPDDVEAVGLADVLELPLRTNGTDGTEP
jgi:hypothetical protein